MIYLKSGQPGHGKTLRAIEQALKFQSEGREIYAAGIKGMKYSEAGFNELVDPTKWEQLPDNAVILLDECYTWFPKASGTQRVPGYIEAMARHRHRGFDFILVCQQANRQLHPFLLGLVEHHEHIRRKFGFKKAIILWWDRYSENVKKSDTKKFWPLPKALMKRNLYESTSMDTTRLNIPWFVWALPISILVLLSLAGYVRGWFSDHTKGAGEAAAGGHGLVGSAVSGQPPQRRPDDLVKWLTPRLPGQPWTAPAYDDRPVASEPEVYCMAVDDGRCGCVTEQGTKYDMELAMCRTVARNGVYNPTRRPAVDQGRQRLQGGPAAAAAVPGQPDAAPSASGGLVARDRATAKPYTPPTYGAWNPDAFGASTKR